MSFATEVKNELCRVPLSRHCCAVAEAYDRGYRHFLCGMAQGCDLYFCEAVLALRERYQEVTVEAAIPCPTQADAWPEAERYRSVSYTHLTLPTNSLV